MQCPWGAIIFSFAAGKSNKYTKYQVEKQKSKMAQLKLQSIDNYDFIKM